MFEHPITPASIAAANFPTFRIPLYQRPYAWEEPQVSQLLTDLYQAFLEGQKSGKPSDYHIGILSIAQTQNDKRRYDLIDGQQRITTLMLIGKAAIFSRAASWGQFLSSERLDLYGREEDKKFLRGEAGAECNRRMADAVRCAGDFLAGKNDRTAFADYIFNHAAFFLSEVPSTYSLLEKNQQFVRMNNRGKQLELHEILKVQLLTKIKMDSERASAFEIWNAMLACLTGISVGESETEISLKDILGSNEAGSESPTEEVLYTSILTVPEFLLLALARFLPPESRAPNFFKKDNLLATFSVMNNEEQIIAFTKLLGQQLETFKSFFIFLSKQERFELGGNNNTENNDFDFGTDSRGEERLIAIQSFLYVSTEPHHWMIPAFEWCQSHVNAHSRPIKSGEFVERLELIDASITQEKKRAVSPIDDLDSMVFGSHISRYWFYRLDYELWKRFHVAAPDGTLPNPIWTNLPKEYAILIENFRFRHCGSVEHIIPQKPMEGSAEDKGDHSFGNLALISSSRNSRFSNLPPPGKMDIILQSGYTESLKMLHFLTCDSGPRSHGDTMFRVLKEIPQS